MLNRLLEKMRAFPLAKAGVPALLDGLSLALLGITCVTMLATVKQYGMTYDETAHLELGDRLLEFYSGGFSVSSRLERTAYGGGFDLVAALLRRWSAFDEYETNHLLCVFVAQLGLLGTLRLGRLVAGPAGGLLALVFLILIPVYYAHQFNNPKDIPFAAGYVWGLYFIARLLAEPELLYAPFSRNTRWFWICASIALGGAMSVRLGGAILIAYLLLFVGLQQVESFRKSGRFLRLDARALRRILGALLGSWLLMLFFWPRALKNPLHGPAAALETVTRYTAYDSPTLLRGREISSNHVPWDYLPSYFAVQLPELLSVAFLAVSAVLLWRVFQALRLGRPLPLTWCLLATAVWVPPLYAILRGSTLYNGLRHFLFVLPPLCALTAAGVAAALSRLRARPGLQVTGLALIAFFAVDQVHALRRLHPHQQVYFNRSAGGTRVGVAQYESEYYGSVYRDLNQQLLETLWRERGIAYLDSTFRVAGCGSRTFFTYNLPLNFEYVAMRSAASADIYATYVRDKCLTRFKERPELVRVERDGATIAMARLLNAAVLPGDMDNDEEVPTNAD